jgi:hypothetical protein
MDDMEGLQALLDLFEESDRAPDEQPQRQPSTSSVASGIANQRTVDLIVDDRVGIRMIRRKISGAEIMDLISDNPYHSTASLSAMSLAALNQLLVNPAAVVDKASKVCGTTNLVTVGIVFSNSGTRLTASGNAFCVLTIGTLATGPAIAALLFGSVYSQFCRTCSPGQVVALVRPRLLPPRKGSSVSFTFNDERHFLLVADAQDFGLCKAKGHCRSYVDLRLGEFCIKHRDSLASSASSTVAPKRSKMLAASRPDGSQRPVGRYGPSERAIAVRRASLANRRVQSPVVPDYVTEFLASLGLR